MTGNYYTLAAVVRELSRDPREIRFLEAYSHRPNELRLRFDTGTIVAVLRPIDGALFVDRRDERRPRTNLQLFFEELQGRVLQSIRIAEHDRIVDLVFDEYELGLQFFGKTNAILSKNKTAISAFRKLIPGNEQSSEASNQGLSMLGRKYRQEFEMEGIPLEIGETMLRSSDKAHIYRHSDEILLSLVPLPKLLSNSSVEIVDSISEAARIVLLERTKLASIKGLRTQLLRQMDSETARLLRTRADMRKGIENSERAARYAAIANGLLMKAHEVSKGALETHIEIEGHSLNVSLDPERNPYENAARYFEKSKRATESKELLHQKVKQIAEHLPTLEELRERILLETSLEGLRNLQRTQSSASPAFVRQEDKSAPFRTYTVAGAMTVLVGKNAKQNDELTLHVAKKEDVWLHARGVPGSHVVLQAGKRSEVPREAIEQAAEIAAYYSDAKTQGLAPVSYTRKKYVRKPKGANPGAVVLEREEVIMVRPQIRGKEA